MRRLALLLVFIAGCAFDGSGLPLPADQAPPEVPTTPEVDAALPDAALPPDARDQPPPPPPPPPQKKGTGAFCDRDEECQSDECVSFGAVGKHCAALCPTDDSVCPIGTQCDDGVCGPD